MTSYPHGGIKWTFLIETLRFQGKMRNYSLFLCPREFLWDLLLDTLSHTLVLEDAERAAKNTFTVIYLIASHVSIWPFAENPAGTSLL